VFKQPLLFSRFFCFREKKLWVTTLAVLEPPVSHSLNHNFHSVKTKFKTGSTSLPPPPSPLPSRLSLFPSLSSLRTFTIIIIVNLHQHLYAVFIWCASAEINRLTQTSSPCLLYVKPPLTSRLLSRTDLYGLSVPLFLDFIDTEKMFILCLSNIAILLCLVLLGFLKFQFIDSQI
jgi:hypothetical protein